MPVSVKKTFNTCIKSRNLAIRASVIGRNTIISFNHPASK